MQIRFAVLIFACLFAGLFALTNDQTTNAATTLPTKMNFQGRIANSSGNILANGTYNMRFKIWSLASGGTLQWSEDRLVSATQGVTVTNGQFSVQLGSITSLPASVFASNSLYFEVELPTPASATTASPIWTEGAMTPRNQLATSAYAYNSETLDGLDSDAFAKLGTSNAFTAANSINFGGTAAFQVGSGVTNLFNVNTSDSIVTIGQADTIGAVLVLDSKTDAGDPIGGSATNGAMYYNANANKFRCYQAGAWTDCIGSGTGASLSANNTFTGTNTFQNTTNSTSALAVNTQTGSSVFKVDTTSQKVTIGDNATASTARVQIEGQGSGSAMAWTARTSAQANTWYSVTYGNGLFVAVADIGTNRVMTSPDGITWTARTAAEANSWYAVTYGNGLFVAVAGTGTNRVMTSPDGITWTARTAAQQNDWYAVTYDNGLFVAVANTGINQVMTSPDGITWTARTAAADGGWTSVTYGNGLYVAVSSTAVSRVMTSPDGITWTARTAAQANAWASVTYGNGLFVAVAGAGANRVMTSPDGITWTARNAAEANQWRAVTYANGLYVAVSGLGTNRVMTSPDGITWTAKAAAPATNTWNSVTYANGQFVAVSADGNVMTASDVALSTRGAVQINGDLFANGDVRARANSTSAFSIQAAGTSQSLFNADTLGQKISIGVSDSTASLLVLDTKNTVGDPAGTNGAMYYNSNANKFRCYQAGAWTDCVGAGGGSTLQGAYDASTSPATITTTAAKGVAIVAGAAPTTDLFKVDNTAQPVVTAEANGIEVNYVGGAAAVQAAGIRVDYTPGGTAGGEWSGIRIVAAATGAASGVSANGLKLEGPTTPGVGTDTALEVGTGWDIGLDIQSGGMQLAVQNDPAAPAAGNLRIYAKEIAGRTMPKWVGPSGVDTPFQASLGFNRIASIQPGTGTAAATATSGFGTGFTNVGTLSNPTPAATNLMTSTRRTTFSSGATAGVVGSHRQGTLMVWRGNAANRGGFFYTTRFSLSSLQAGNRAFVGLIDSVAAPTNVDPIASTASNKVGMAINANTGNWALIHNAAATAPTSIALGANFPINTTDLYELIIYSAQNGTSIGYRVTNVSTSTLAVPVQASGSITTNMPSNTTFLAPMLWITNNATAAAASMDFGGWYLESDF